MSGSLRIIGTYLLLSLVSLVISGQGNMSHIYFPEGKKLVMAHILLPLGYATDQSGTIFGIVSHRNATFYVVLPDLRRPADLLGRYMYLSS